MYDVLLLLLLLLLRCATSRRNLGASSGTARSVAGDTGIARSP